MREALIDVIMPTYNQEATINLAIESFLNQTLKRSRLIISDDCSSDETYTLAKSYESKRVIVLRNDHNLGVTGNLNRLLALVEAPFTANMGGDDIFLPQKLEKQLRILTNSKCIATGHKVALIDESGRKLGELGKRNSGYIGPQQWVKYGMRAAAISIVWRSTDIRFSESLGLAADLYFFIEMMQKSSQSFYYSNEILAYYRKSPRSISVSRRKECIADMRKSYDMLLERQVKGASFGREYLCGNYAKAIENLEAGRKRIAFKELLLFARLYPFELRVYFRLLQIVAKSFD